MKEPSFALLRSFKRHNTNAKNGVKRKKGAAQARASDGREAGSDESRSPGLYSHPVNCDHYFLNLRIDVDYALILSFPKDGDYAHRGPAFELE